MPQLPNYGSWLIEYLSELGFVNANSSLGYAEIKAWADITRTNLNTWESVQLRRLSAEYYSAFLDYSENKDKVAPYQAGIATNSADRRKAVIDSWMR